MGVIAPNSIVSRYGLSEAVINDLRRVFSDFSEIERVLIFGSRAKGTFKDGSDIDLAVVAPTLTEQGFAALWNAVDDLPIVFKVDLLHWDRLSNQVLKEAASQQGLQVFP